jgi:hypothetical protein
LGKEKAYSELKEKGKVRKGDIIPDVDAFVFYVEAFCELGTCRNSGMDLSPIPFLAIVEYAKLYDVGDVEDFLYIIRCMDNAYLKANSRKRENKPNVHKTVNPKNSHKGRR